MVYNPLGPTLCSVIAQNIIPLITNTHVTVCGFILVASPLLQGQEITLPFILAEHQLSLTATLLL